MGSALSDCKNSDEIKSEKMSIHEDTTFHTR